MPTVIQKMVLAREERDEAEAEFRKAILAARKNGMSWSQIATAVGMSIYGVRYLAQNQKKRRKARPKGETNGTG